MGRMQNWNLRATNQHLDAAVVKQVALEEDYQVVGFGIRCC